MKSFALLVLVTIFFTGSRCKQISPVEQPGRHDLHPELLGENTVAVVNSEVILRCGASDIGITHSIQWWDYSYSESGILISENGNIGSHPSRDRYSIIRDHTHEYSLRISPVLMSDGGTYMCLDSWGNPSLKSRHALQLTVLAAEALCITTLPAHGMVLVGNYHTNVCYMDYKGGLIPNMTWTGEGPFSSLYVATPTQVMCGMEFYVTRAMDTRSHVMDLFFTDYFYPVDGDSSDVVPDHIYVHREIQMFVYWVPTDMSHEPQKDYYEVGDELTCYADAFPPPTYQWQNLRDGAQVYEQHITVEESWLGHNQTLRCEATNNIADFTFSSNYFTAVYVPLPTTATTPTTTVASTLPPAVSECLDLSGAWESTFPARASICIKLDLDNNGLLQGLAKNSTDTIWVDIVGRSTGTSFAQVTFAGIWPLEMGVSSFVGECHRCFGIERILAHVTTRIRGDTQCGVSGPASHTTEYQFYRSTTLRCPVFGKSMK